MRDIVYVKARGFELIKPNYTVLTAAPARTPVKIPARAPVKKKKAIPKHVKTIVWDTYIGADKAIAACCCCLFTEISIRNFHCGHVIAEVNGGDLTIQNLRPICAPCNLSMGRRNMNEFTKEFFGWLV
jgi:hypothetical protein